MTQLPKFEMIFTGNAAPLKAATADVKTDIAAVGTEANKVSTALDNNANALDREAAAAKRAAQANRELAKAEKEARDQVNRATGATPSAPVHYPTSPSSLPTSQPSSGALPSTTPLPGLTADELEKRRAAYIPLVKAQRDYRLSMEAVQKDEAAGVLSSSESAAEATKLTAAYERQAHAIKMADPALRGHTGQVKLASHEWKNLSFQASDTIQTLALGMPPLQVFLQQGPQAVDAVGGLGNAFKLVSQVMTPFRVGMGLTTAAVVVASMAWDGYLQSTKEVATAASGLGRATAGTAEDMEAAAVAGAAAAGISVGAARSMEAQFLRTGKIGSESFEKLIGISKNFGATFGISAAEAGDKLSEMFADPAKAADVLSRQYGLIDGATAKLATRLVAQNRTFEAQELLLSRLPNRLSDASEATTLLGRAWESVATGASNAYDAVGKAVDRAVNGMPRDEEIDRLQKRLASRRAAANQGSSQRVIDSEQAELDRLLSERRGETEARERARGVDQRRQMGAFATGIANQSPVTAEQRQLQAIADQLQALQRGSNAPGQDAEDRSAVAATIDATARALATWIPEQEKAAKLLEIDAKLQTERNPLLRANLAAERERMVLAGQMIAPAKAEQQIALERQRALSQSLAGSADQSRAMRDEATVRSELAEKIAKGTITASEAQGMLAQELALRPQIAAAALAEGKEKADLEKAVQDLRDSYRALTAAEKTWASLDMKKGQDERIAALQLEKRLIGETTAERTRATILAEAERDIKSRGLTGAEADARRTDAGRVADATVENDRARSAYDLDTSRTMDGFDLRLQTARDPVSKANLEGERERQRLLRAGADADYAAAEATRVRNQSLSESTAGAATQAKNMQEELAVRLKLDQQVAAGTITQGDAQRLMNEELQLRPLIAAAAAAEGADKQKLLDIITQLRTGYAGLAAAEKDSQAVAELKSGSQRLEQLRLEQQLIGQTEATREQALARMEAEQRIRELGIATDSERANQIRALADEEARLTVEIDRQTAAWEKVKGAAGSAIDDAIDGLKKGDFKGALKSVVDDFEKAFTELAVKNPLKNALLGEGLPTMNDVGGLLGKLFGGSKSAAASPLGQSVASMSVSAGTVMINCGLLGTGSVLGNNGALGSSNPFNAILGGAANNNGTSGLSGVIANYASAIKKMESGGNYGALGPITRTGDRAYGAYQVMGANIPSWSQQALGKSLTPSQFLASSSSQDAVFEKIFGGYVDRFGASGASKAWIGGPGAVNGSGKTTDMLGTSINQYAEKFNTEVGGMAQAAGAATGGIGNLANGFAAASTGLGNFGGGLNQFSQQLASISAGGGSGGSILGGLGKLFGGLSPTNPFWAPNTSLGSFLKFGYTNGGYTGPGGIHEPKGVVHAEEIVWSQRDIARAGGIQTVEAMRLGRRGYAEGGIVSSAPSPSFRPWTAANDSGSAASSAQAPSINVYVDNPRGDRDIEDAIDRGVRRGVKAYDKQMPARIAQINKRPLVRGQ